LLTDFCCGTNMLMAIAPQSFGGQTDGTSDRGI